MDATQWALTGAGVVISALAGTVVKLWNDAKTKDRECAAEVARLNAAMLEVSNARMKDHDIATEMIKELRTQNETLIALVKERK